MELLSLIVLSGCTQTRPPVPQQRSNIVSAVSQKKFIAHPGKLHVHLNWNNSDEMIDASTLPESRQYIYYDQDAHETRELERAKYRVPIVEEVVTSLSSDGKSVEPRYADFISITQYGPGHKYLRETQARNTHKQSDAAK